MNDMLAQLPEFLSTSAGIALLAVIAVVLIIFIIDLNYRFFAKYLLDFIAALVASIVLSPVFIITAIVVKKRTGKGGGILTRTPYVGAKGKIIEVRSFSTLKCGLKNLPRLFDVICGRMSIIGPKLTVLTDAALIDDEFMERFNTRPGLISPLVRGGFKEMTYEEMFAADVRYAKKRELFKDILIFLTAAVKKTRGEGEYYLGETALKSYAQTLFERGTITLANLETAESYAEEALKNAGLK